MGGFLALTAGSELPAARCIGSISGANLGLRAGLDAETARAVAERLEGMRAPLRGTSGTALVAEIGDNGERFDLRRRASALAPKRLLLVAAERDRVTPPAEHHDPLVEALRVAGASPRAVRLDADHAYSERRVTLAREVVSWLAEDCGG